MSLIATGPSLQVVAGDQRKPVRSSDVQIGQGAVEDRPDRGVDVAWCWATRCGASTQAPALTVGTVVSIVAALGGVVGGGEKLSG